jgi:hypothetical protein
LTRLLDEHLDGDGDPECDGDGGDQDGKGKGRPKLSEEEKRQIRDEIKEAMLAAASATQDAGNIPAGVKRLIKDLTEPQMNWRELLRMQLESLSSQTTLGCEQAAKVGTWMQSCPVVIKIL